MAEIELTGLRGDLPIGAMAAFGVLRLCGRLRGFRGSKLGWGGGGGADHAVLGAPDGCTRDSLVAALLEDVKTAPLRPELTWSDQIKTATVEQFREYAAAAIASASASNRDAADWFAAFGTELEEKEGKIESTPFDMSVARQRFLADALKLAQGLSEDRPRGKTAEESYREALFGPWKYEDDQHSLGWDPTTMKLGAFTHKAPTAMANAGVRAAIWLAFESLPLFPCFWPAPRKYAFYWPVWREPIGIEVLRSLLAWLPDAQFDDLRARGVAAAYRSEVFKPNKYLFNFRTPELLFGGAATAA